MENRIKTLRKQKGLTQSQLSERIGFDSSVAGKWELGKTEPNLQTLFQLADFFGVTVEYLYCHD
ncbi:transcriptional regulator [Secundilactobacillus pentosiphilus]|uniref:Transcriptional regulator n=1 Tax=Secundilactobacillus pentosiphilus TaxID=1714682 RepID=A0A1Z5IZ73_9LACO|nr:helix-turn-helix transcriptional regulator [Secundilactobacillus pentosiphilus]GAX04577.1 transcriptional regulator [Secundilactobacillus pentosiphilus]GAX07085.1 transcriptional regulator [Secundilactobacillus pentosiphilus]